MKDTTAYVLVLVLGILMLLFVLEQAEQEQDQMNFHEVATIYQYNDEYYNLKLNHISIDSLTLEGLEVALQGVISTEKDKCK